MRQQKKEAAAHRWLNGGSFGKDRIHKAELFITLYDVNEKESQDVRARRLTQQKTRNKTKGRWLAVAQKTKVRNKLGTHKARSVQ